MSKQVDIDQLERDMGDASSEYVTIHYDELMNLIQRVRSGEQYHADMKKWLAEFAERFGHPYEAA